MFVRIKKSYSLLSDKSNVNDILNLHIMNGAALWL